MSFGLTVPASRPVVAPDEIHARRGIEIAGGPPLSRLFAQFAAAGGEIYVCPVCFKARGLDAAALLPNARLAGGTRAADHRRLI